MKKHGDKLSPCSHNSVVLQFFFVVSFSNFVLQTTFAKLPHLFAAMPLSGGIIFSTKQYRR